MLVSYDADATGLLVHAATEYPYHHVRGNVDTFLY
jgi:hypothetical protein